MKGNFNTDYGKVVIENNVIARLAGMTAVGPEQERWHCQAPHQEQPDQGHQGYGREQ